MSAKEKIVEAAEELLREHGFTPTSVDEICRRAGVSKGSFYHFFESKEDLAVAAIDAFMARGAAIMAEGDFTGIDDPVERSLAFLDFLEERSDDLWGKGCLIGSLAIEVSRTHPKIREHVERMFEQFLSLSGEALEPLAGQVKGKVDVTGRDLARMLASVLEGGIVMSRGKSDPDYLPWSIRNFRRYLTALAA